MKTTKAIFTLIFISALMLSYGCSSPNSVVKPLATISISPTSKSLATGDSQAFTATGRDSSGDIVSFTPTWTVTGGIGTITSSGVFTATTLGAGKVKAISGSIIAESSVVVNPRLSTITISPSSKSLLVGGTQTFTATAKDSSGRVVSFTPTWSVTGGIGTITSSGVFTATTAGTGKVQASSGSTVAEASVVVSVTPPVATITISPASKTLVVGDIQTFIATGRDSSGNIVPITPTWSVTGGIGSVTSSGAFTASAAGTGKVKATSGSIVGESSVTVNLPLATITISPASKTLVVGDIQTFTATGRDSSGNIVPITPTWSVTGGIGTVTSSGGFTARLIGTGKVRATLGSIVGESSVTVNPLVVTLYAVQHTFADSGNPSTPLYNYADNWCGWWGADIMTSYVQFDTSSIPSTAIVGDAVLDLYVDQVVTGPLMVEFYRCASAWVESLLTYNNRPAGTGPLLAIDTYYTGNRGWTNTNFSGSSAISLVQSWIDGSIPNYGLKLIPSLAGYSTHVEYLSRYGGINIPRMGIRIDGY